MKTMVKLAMVVAVLLLLNGVSFAAGCWNECYELTYTNMDSPGDPMEVCATFQFCDDNTGAINSPLADASMALFFDPMKQEALAISDGCAGYFKFHGDYLYVVKGMVGVWWR